MDVLLLNQPVLASLEHLKSSPLLGDKPSFFFKKAYGEIKLNNRNVDSVVKIFKYTDLFVLNESGSTIGKTFSPCPLNFSFNSVINKIIIVLQQGKA